jgi:hypothetical protein
MSGNDQLRTGLAIFMLGCALCLQGSAQQAQTAGAFCLNQSPRRLINYNTRLDRPTVTGDDQVLTYTPPGGKPVVLQRCGQHYHCRIENWQPECLGQEARELGRPPLCAQPSEDSWVEIHTVYAPRNRGQGCDKETLNCCEGLPVVVKAFHAKVRPGGTPVPIPVLWEQPSAEWSGSNTGPDDFPGDCKPVPARWSFTLGCNFTVTWAQLGLFHHPEPARGIQPSVSNDLALIPR